MRWTELTPLLVALLVAGGARASGEKPENCGTFYTAIPPFYVTSVSDRSSETMAGGNLYGSPSAISSELLRDANRPKSASRVKDLGRGSLVRISGPKRAELAKQIEAKGKGFLVPVEVMKAEETFSPHKDVRTYSKTGDKGLLWSASLRKSDEKFIFILQQDTRLYSFPGTLKAGTALQPVQQLKGGIPLFKAWGCPPDDTADPASLTYFFEPYDLLAPIGQEVAISQCLPPPLQPVSKEMHAELSDLQRMLKLAYDKEPGLHEFEVNDFGRVRLPVDENGVGPNGDFVCYSPRQLKCIPTWGKPRVVCSTLKLAARWKRQCMAALKSQAESTAAVAKQSQAELESYTGSKGGRAQKKLALATKRANAAAERARVRDGKSDALCTLQLGDFAFATPGVRENGKGPLGHLTHNLGDCVDVRPMRNDGVFAGTNVTAPEYDRPLTSDLVTFLKGAGANSVLFGDPVLSPGVDKMEWAASHKDHIHFCLGEDVAESLCSADN